MCQTLIATGPKNGGRSHALRFNNKHILIGAVLCLMVSIILAVMFSGDQRALVSLNFSGTFVLATIIAFAMTAVVAICSTYRAVDRKGFEPLVDNY